MLDAHPLCEVVPDMSEEEYAALVEDIGQRGQLLPIVVYEGKILDGRHRYRAMRELAEKGPAPEPQFEKFEGTPEEARAFVESLNYHRRHLSYSQRAALAAEWKQEIQVVRPQGVRTDLVTSSEIGGSSGEAAQIAGIRFQVGKTAVNEAENILEVAPDLFDVMKDGGIGLREAQSEVRRRERETRVSETPPMTGKYRVLYADAPWKYGTTGVTITDKYGGAEKHYPTMTIEELCALPVADISEKDSVLFFWVTSPMLGKAFDIISAWGFDYKTSIVWNKDAHNYGYYVSVRHELLLIATRGSCRPDIQVLLPSVVTIKRSKEHSEKPKEFREMIDRMYPHGARIELFAREALPEPWVGWGNEYAG